MATVIKFLLQVSPSHRPTCDQILALPIVESLSKKFFPESLSIAAITERDNNAMLKTIRLSKNLFSLTERLPKNKYRGRSNELPSSDPTFFKLKSIASDGRSSPNADSHDSPKVVVPEQIAKPRRVSKILSKKTVNNNGSAKSDGSGVDLKVE